MLRRVTALIVMLVTVGGTLEVGVGLAREGKVHHESTARAVTHATAASGPSVNHGHEDGTVQLHVDGTAESHEDHSQHEHGTCLDHCTHVHGLAVPGHRLPTFVTPVVHLRIVADAKLPPQPDRSELFQPPRA